MCIEKLFRLSLLFLFAATVVRAQAPTTEPRQEPGEPQAAGQWLGLEDEHSRPLIGKITAIHKGEMELARPDGSNVTVKITNKTEYRKDRQNAKLGDFKIGEMVFVRAEENGDQGMTALMVAGRSGRGPEGGGAGGSSGGITGELGKDYVVGEVKTIDAPKITILRPDNVMQTLELSEETSLRKGRESVTMADIQPGDHVFVRGAVQDKVFVPKNVMVISPEQWKRIQEMGVLPRGNKGTSTSKRNPPQP